VYMAVLYIHPRGWPCCTYIEGGWPCCTYIEGDTGRDEKDQKTGAYPMNEGWTDTA
jgi:hypothetical protein